MTDWNFLAFALGSTLALAGGGLLLLVGYIGTLPAAFNQGLRTGLPVLLLPVLGPLWFAHRQGEAFRRERLQLIAGSLLLLLAAGLIMGYGPYFAEQQAAELIEAAKQR